MPVSWKRKQKPALPDYRLLGQKEGSCWQCLTCYASGEKDQGVCESSSLRCLGQDAVLSSRERNQEETNQDQMESVFQQQRVVSEIKENLGSRPNAALGVPQTCSLWGIAQTQGRETGRHLPEHSVSAVCFTMLEIAVWLRERVRPKPTWICAELPLCSPLSLGWTLL